MLQKHDFDFLTKFFIFKSKRNKINVWTLLKHNNLYDNTSKHLDKHIDQQSTKASLKSFEIKMKYWDDMYRLYGYNIQQRI